MPSIPLSYECQKLILQFTEANKRIQLTRRCPSLRTTEKCVPLYINTLYFDYLQFCINGVTYRLGVHRDYHSAECVTNYIKNINRRGGVQEDQDMWGIPDSSYEKRVFPGDVLITSEPETPKRSDEHIRVLLEQGIEESEAIMETCRNQFAELRRSTDQFRQISNLKNWETTFNEKRDLVDKYKSLLLPYNYKRDNTPVPFTMTLQLRTSTTGIERVAYKKSIHEAMKYLTSVIFGGRRCPVIVKRFEVGHDPKILRVPENFKLKISELKVNGDFKRKIEPLSSIFHESSYPLQVLHSDGSERYDHKTARESRRIRIAFPFFSPQVVRNSLNFKNDEVALSFNDGNVTVGGLLDIVRIRMNTRMRGQLFLEVDDEKTIHNLLEAIGDQFDGVKTLERCVEVPVNDGTTLRILYEKLANKERIPMWELKMKDENGQPSDHV